MPTGNRVHGRCQQQPLRTQLSHLIPMGTCMIKVPTWQQQSHAISCSFCIQAGRGLALHLVAQAVQKTLQAASLFADTVDPAACRAL